MNRERRLQRAFGLHAVGWACLMVLLRPSDAKAQAYGYISEPISPTSYDECKQMSDEFQAAMDDVMKQGNACVNHHMKQEFPMGDIGGCCHEYAGADGVRAGACWEGFSPCWPIKNQWYCLVNNRSAAVSRCQDKVKEYQRKQEEERKKKEEEQRRAEEAARENNKDATSESSSSSQKSKPTDEKTAFQKQVEAYDKETDRLAELTAERNAQAHQLDRATAKANKKLSAEAERTATANNDVLTRLAELSGSLGHSKDLGSGKADTDPSPAFDFAGGDATLDKTLAGAGFVVDHFAPFASIPFSMVSRAFRAELGLMNQVAAAVQNFDHLDPSFGNRNFAAEFGQQVFSPGEFLRTVGTNAAAGVVHENLVKPAAERAGDLAAESGSSTVVRPVVLNQGGSLRGAVGESIATAEPHWMGTVVAPSSSGSSTIASVSAENDYLIYWAPLRYDSPAVITESWRRWWVSHAVGEGLDAVVDRLVSPGSH